MKTGVLLTAGSEVTELEESLTKQLVARRCVDELFAEIGAQEV